MDNYVILMDENGQPYIAHSVKTRVKSGWGKVKNAGKRAYGSARRAGSKAHKYMLRIGEGAKAQYAYTKEEVDRLLGRGRHAVNAAATKSKEAVRSAAAKGRQKARDVIGITARDNLKAAEAAQKRAERVDAIREHRYQQARKGDVEAESAALKADAAARMAGYGAERAKREAARARGEVAADRRAYDQSEGRYKQQHEKFFGDEYDVGKTLGRAVSKSAREAHAKDKEELARLDTQREDAYKTLKAGERALQEAYDDQRRAMSERRMADRELDKADRDAGVARDKRIEANRSSLDSYSAKFKADEALRYAQADYAATPLAKVKSLIGSGKKALDAAKDYASEKLDDLKETADNVRESGSKAVTAVKAAGERAKDRGSDAIERAKETGSKAVTAVKAAQNKAEKEWNTRKATREVKKVEDSYSKWRNEFTRPKDGVFTLDKATGKTVRMNERYDFYTDQINNIFSEIKSRPNMSESERKGKLSYAKTLMGLAEQYAVKKG